jgi:tetratricopeptide (TPR) repeat protein
MLSGEMSMKIARILLLLHLITFKYAAASSAETLHNYLWANYNHFAGNIPHAQHWYEKLFATNNSVYTYKGYLNFLADTKQFKQITDLIPHLQKKFSNDADIQLLFTTALEKVNRNQEADNHIIVLSQTFKTHAEISLRAAQTYTKRKEPENALLTIDAFLNNTPRKANNFVFYFLKTQIYMQLSQFTHALENIQKCLEMHPHFDKGWLLCASLHEKEGKIKEALSGYATFLELSGGNKEVEKHLVNLMLRYKSLEDNNQILLSHNISIDNALLLFKQHRYPQALAHINSCITQQPHSNECKLLKLQILSALKDFKNIAQVAHTWITADPQNDLWPKSLCLLAHNGMPRTQIIETFTDILKTSPDNVWCNVYCADLCLRTEKKDIAKQCLTNALSCNTTDTIRAKTLYQLAMLAYEDGDHNTMRKHLENAYELTPHNAHINNALAYYWATKGKDIAKAHTFIDKALVANNNNPYFLDTQAVILYKEKKYDQAYNILEKLDHHNNGTILLHLAKVHYALNNKENADIFTQKAHALVKNSHEKKSVEKMQLLLTQT